MFEQLTMYRWPIMESNLLFDKCDQIHVLSFNGVRRPFPLLFEGRLNLGPFHVNQFGEQLVLPAQDHQEFLMFRRQKGKKTLHFQPRFQFVPLAWERCSFAVGKRAHHTPYVGEHFLRLVQSLSDPFWLVIHHEISSCVRGTIEATGSREVNAEPTKETERPRRGRSVSHRERD